MANAFKNASLIAPGSGTQTLYTCPNATEAIVFATMASNIDGTTDYTLDMDLVRNVSPLETWTLAEQLPIPAQSVSDFPKITLNAGDTIDIGANADNVIRVTLSILEIS